MPNWESPEIAYYDGTVCIVIELELSDIAEIIRRRVVMADGMCAEGHTIHIEIGLQEPEEW